MSVLTCPILELKPFPPFIPNENVLLAGDFNFSKLSMECSNIFVPNTTEYSEFHQFVTCSNFEQHVMETTRVHNMLHLFLSNSQLVIENVHVVEGISDHGHITASISLNETTLPVRSSERKVSSSCIIKLTRVLCHMNCSTILVFSISV